MKRFFCSATVGLLHKNKLQQAVQLYIKTLDRLLITEDEFPAFKQQIFDTVEAYNKEFPRCRPVEVHYTNNRFVDSEYGIKLNFYIQCNNETIIGLSLTLVKEH